MHAVTRNVLDFAERSRAAAPVTHQVQTLPNEEKLVATNQPRRGIARRLGRKGMNGGSKKSTTFMPGSPSSKGILIGSDQKETKFPLSCSAFRINDERSLRYRSGVVLRF